ncbi:hypothetical protein H072_1223 [Dactylellina haptotyla CBS 200.50]|uniref:Methyltransferase domain-containing protein n=1 Tax=Dactylellina haptotyla (strain CBS 200.50) TaxID=1284197 RepID=S8CAP4_DACHA|nr:hypothetical protein H072_1223 [Dactylellina haptotyla CBS 200.50]
MSSPPGKKGSPSRGSPPFDEQGQAGGLGSEEHHYLTVDSGDSADDDFWDSDAGSITKALDHMIANCRNTRVAQQFDDRYNIAERANIRTNSLDNPGRVENGRRYNANAAGQSEYQFPVDELEQDRLDLMHHIFKSLLHGELYISPIAGTNPQRILDLGTGTGIWAIEIADQFPSAAVVGTDLAPIQPTWVPPNLEFQIDDCEADWTFGKSTFDFIHIRYLRAAISNWPRLYQQAYDTLRPGGYFEFQDPDLTFLTDDGSLPEDAALTTYINHFHQACQKMGKHTRGQPQSVADELYKIGFEDVKVVVKKCPQNPWPKDPHLKTLGRYSLLNLLDGLEGFAMKLFTGMLGWSKEEVDIFVLKLKRESVNKHYHMYFNYYFVSGRKPLTAS